MPVPDDYAFGWSIDIRPDADFHEIVLPMAVYRAATDATLRDIGVYDADNQPVPRVIRQPRLEQPRPPLHTELPLLPLYRTTAGQELAVSADGRIEVAVGWQGGNLTVTVDEPDDTPAQAAKSPVAYVLDLEDIGQPIDTLVLHWPQSAETFIGRLHVSASNDLERWIDVGSGSLAELRHAGHEVQRRSVNISPRRKGFLRLTWSGVPDGWNLERVEGRHKSAIAPVNREHLVVPQTGLDDSDGGRVFDTGGGLLVDRVTLTLPQDNSIVTGAIYTRHGSDAAWRLSRKELFYHLRRGGDALVNEPLDVSPTRLRHWKVVIERGRQDIDVSLELGWRPDNLVFLAQGRPPYTLVAGRAQDKRAGFPQERRVSDPAMRQLIGDDRLGLAVSAATLGDRQTLGGPEQLSLPVQLPWRRWMLWLGLSVGVLLIGTMAHSLLRQRQAASRSDQ